MSEATTRTQAQLHERRQTKAGQIFRKRLGAIAVIGTLAAVTISAGGARPLAHDVIGAIKNRVTMIGDAFTPEAMSDDSSLTPEQARIREQIQATRDRNDAVEADASRQQ